MKLTWTPEAIADRESIYDYIEADNPRAALELDEQFSRRASQLATHPMIGRTGRVPFTRELVVRPDYLLLLRVSCEKKFRALVISYILAGIAVIATAFFVGEPYGILFALFLPALFFLWPILVFQIVICPYCGQSDPVGLMFSNNDSFPVEPRSECPTCRGLMYKPFDPNFRSGLQQR